MNFSPIIEVWPDHALHELTLEVAAPKDHEAICAALQQQHYLGAPSARQRDLIQLVRRGEQAVAIVVWTRAARKLAAHGPREIVLTQSSGVTVYADGKTYQAPFTPRNLSGRTGRGDTCFGTYVAKRLSLSPEDACRWAGAVTTLKQEQPGPWRGSPADVEALLKSRS